MQPFIRLQQAELTFRMHNQPGRSIKETALNLILRRRYARPAQLVHAIRGVDLHVQTGQRLGIVGDNGSGKSSLLKLISRIYPPTAGTVQTHGFLVPLLEVGIGFNAELSAIENIFLTGAIMGLSRKKIAPRTDRILDFAELDGFKNTPVKYLSSGMQQRLAFSVATDIDPQILLLDEVFSVGDIHWIEKARQRMKDLIDRTSILLLVSHQLELIEAYCNRAIWLRNGMIHADGPPAEVVAAYREQPATPPSAMHDAEQLANILHQ